MLDIVNIGGGFPAPYQDEVPPLSMYAEEIANALNEAFGPSHPELMLEPGRSLVAEAGVIQSEVVLVSRSPATTRSAGSTSMSANLAAWQRPSTRVSSTPCGRSEQECPAQLFWQDPPAIAPTSSMKRPHTRLPLDLDAGDRVEILLTGAYTSSYASVGFNGFSPLRTHCL